MKHRGLVGVVGHSLWARETVVDAVGHWRIPARQARRVACASNDGETAFLFIAVRHLTGPDTVLIGVQIQTLFARQAIARRGGVAGVPACAARDVARAVVQRRVTLRRVAWRLCPSKVSIPTEHCQDEEQVRKQGMLFTENDHASQVVQHSISMPVVTTYTTKREHTVYCQ